jgi:hypothetical protein
MVGGLTVRRGLLAPSVSRSLLSIPGCADLEYVLLIAALAVGGAAIAGKLLRTMPTFVLPINARC